MSHPTIVEDISAPIAQVLIDMFNSGSSEQYAVADCLNTIAENGDESATDEHLVTCAEELRDAAQRVINAVNPEVRMSPETAAAMESMGELDIFDRLIYEATKTADQMDIVYAERVDDGTGPRSVTEALRAAIAAVKAHLQNNVSNRGGKLELHTFKDRQLTLVERCYKDAAGGKDGELEFDDPLVVSESDDGGAYVLGWTWVDDEDVTLPKRFACVLSSVTEAGQVSQIAEDSFIAADEDHARELMIHDHWDERLTAASCHPRVDFKELKLTTFKFKLVDDDDAGLDPIEVEAVSREEAIEILNMIRPMDEVEEDVDDDEESKEDDDETEE